MAKSLLTPRASEIKTLISQGHDLIEVATAMGVAVSVLRVWLYRNAAKYDIDVPIIFHNWTHKEEHFLWESRKAVANFKAIRYFWPMIMKTDPPSVMAMKTRVRQLKERGFK